MAPYLLPEITKRYNKVDILKKTNAYFLISCDEFTFKDALLFSSPMNLSTYLKQNNVTEEKSVFPYSKFNSVAEIRNCETFPIYEDFFSELKNENIPFSDYKKAKNEFENRKQLPEDHPLKINSMIQWLEYYNLLDVVPLAEAINNSFANFFTIFQIDPSFCCSLPKYAQICMFEEYDTEEPFCYSFDRRRSDIRCLFREQGLLGGLVNVFHRFTDLTKDPEVPLAAQYAPNGNPYTRISFFDFNSLYLYCQLLQFPSSQGIEWVKYPRRFSKRIMTSGCSLEQIQWLTFEQETNECLTNLAGERIIIENAYTRGEKQIGPYKCDGYANIDGVDHFWEYLGCFYHPNCPYEQCQYFGGKKDIVWEKKDFFLKNLGVLHVMRGCVWQMERKKLKNMNTPSLPLILNSWGTQIEILAGIEYNELFGFIIADISTPDEVYEKIKWINFPPLICRDSIDESMLSPYMLSRCKKRGTKLPQKTLIQVYNSKQLLLYTPLVRFYIKLGLRISNISKFIQYKPSHVFSKFVDKITDGRIRANKEGNKSLELAYKIIGNS